MWLNVLLSLLTLTSTLAAFGGQTWRDGTEPFLYRITRRGWISLTCLVATFGFGILKEYRSERTHDELSLELISKTNQLALMEERLTKTQAALESNVGEIADAAFVQLEVRFNALASVPRMVYYGLTYFNSDSATPFVDDEHGRPLILYAGDSVDLTLDAKGPTKYPLVGLQIGPESYQLNDPGRLGAVPTQFAVKGRHSEPMHVSIINPDHASGSIKWLVTSTTTVRQDKEFKEWLSRVDVPDDIKRSYLVVEKAGAVILATPDENANVIERPEEGFLVKRVLATKDWVEIQMPGGRLGWMNPDALEQLL